MYCQAMINLCRRSQFNKWFVICQNEWKLVLSTVSLARQPTFSGLMLLWSRCQTAGFFTVPTYSKILVLLFPWQALDHAHDLDYTPLVSIHICSCSSLLPLSHSVGFSDPSSFVLTLSLWNFGVLLTYDMISPSFVGRDCQVWYNGSLNLSASVGFFVLKVGSLFQVPSWT